MKFLVVAVGHRMPAWVDAAFSEYSNRMPREARVELVAVKPVARGAPLQRVLEAEAKRILAAMPAGCIRVALD
ncbi:MAG: 23S rRNA (pseudouridine(1915)-N(3))-methyltransferase RlmH, partial [Burkholderiales bacterium]